MPPQIMDVQRYIYFYLNGNLLTLKEPHLFHSGITLTAAGGLFNMRSSSQKFQIFHMLYTLQLILKCTYIYTHIPLVIK